MTRRQGLMEKYKQQMKAYKKQRLKVDSTPYYDSGTTEVILAYVKDPSKKFLVPLVDLEIDGEPAEKQIAEGKMDEEGNRYERKSRRSLITSIKCPICGEWMEWSRNWEAFRCGNYETHKRIYSLSPEKYDWLVEHDENGEVSMDENGEPIIRRSFYFELQLK